MHFKKIGSLLIAFFVLFQSSVIAQDSAAVKWQATGKKIAAGQYEIKLTGTIKAGWHVYAKSNAAAGLEGLKISFSDPAIPKPSQIKFLKHSRRLLLITWWFCKK